MNLDSVFGLAQPQPPSALAPLGLGRCGTAILVKHPRHPRSADHEVPRQTACGLVAAYVLADPEVRSGHRDQLARGLDVAATRNAWDAGAWREAYDYLHHLARPGGPFLGGDPALAAALALCVSRLGQMEDARAGSGGAHDANDELDGVQEGGNDE